MVYRRQGWQGWSSRLGTETSDPGRVRILGFSTRILDFWILRFQDVGVLDVGFLDLGIWGSFVSRI